MEKWRERRSKASQNGDIKTLSTAAFLGKDGSTPYVKPEELLAFNDNGRIADIEGMATLFNLIKGRHQIIINRKDGKDKAGKAYKYQPFNNGGMADGAKVVLISRMADFFNDLYSKKVITEFTYDELLEEAERA
ncbi:hypothetical protein [Mucilaginibacter lacusdianchii]|uniref:hypothetical protein n=1 Tax=Mucilaginibacter lacusdianchii TaxID=2684211 RepID=UPI00131BA343|nr:hypothetical protein [Mucilaginibacter sp. JXJ CY 39]